MSCNKLRIRCMAPGCNNYPMSNGERVSSGDLTNLMYCRKHVRWIKANGNLTPPKYARGELEFRFWKHVDKRGDDECWEWKADVTRGGYGSLWNNDIKRNVSAHRLSYEIHYGKIDKGMLVLHSCDNKKCVNPKHLRQGTVKENVHEAIDRGLRQKCSIPKQFGEQNPKSKLTLEQVRFIRANPQLGHKEIADMWGLSPNCIRGVRIGRTWKGIE